MSFLSPLKEFYVKFKRIIKPAVLFFLFPGKRKKFGKNCNILWLVCSYGYGDIFQHTMIPRELKKIFPESNLTVVTRKKYFSFFSRNKNTDFIEELPYGLDADVKAPFSSLFLLYRIIKKHKPDIILDFPCGLHIYELFLYRLAGAKLVYQNDEREYSNNFVRFIPADLKKHRIEMFQELLKELGAESSDLSPEYEIQPADLKEAKEKIADSLNCGGIKPFLLFNPEASTETRSLPERIVKETVSELRKVLPEYYVVVSCYKRKPHNMAVPGAVMISFDSIDTLAAATSLSSGILSVDTSTAHIADIFCIPLATAYVKYYKADSLSPQPRGKFWQSRQPGTINLYHDYNSEYNPHELAIALKESVDFKKRNPYVSIY